MGDTRMPNSREAVLLAILIPGEKYGRDIREEYKRQTKEELPLGSLYVTLDRMEDKGFLKSWMGDSASDRGGNRRKYYKITASGKNAFEQARQAALGIFGGRLSNG